MEKIGIIGAGGVGAACVFSLIMRGCAREIVLLDINAKRAQGVITDMQYGAPLSPKVTLKAGDYDDLKESAVILITAGINEQTGGATDRNDPSGRLKLLSTNASVYEEIIPKIMAVAPDAVLLVVTDPPDPLAQLTRSIAGHEKVLSAGTYLDSLRFCWHLANHLQISPNTVQANVIGEHGTTEVFLWSTATVGGIPISNLNIDQNLRTKIEQEVRYANITIIEGIKASQYGVGMVCARIAEIIIRDEHAVIPIGSFNAKYGVTLSMPSVVGQKGVIKILEPAYNAEEKAAFEKSVEALKTAFATIK